MHNLFDGWTAAAADHAGPSTGSGIGVGLIAHKIPEAIVFGLMLRSSTNRTDIAVLNVGLTNVALLAGGMMHWSLGAVSETTPP